MPSNVLVRAERLALLLFAAGLCARTAGAQSSGDSLSNAQGREEGLPQPPVPARTPRGAAGYQHWLGGVYLGSGLRFNNPYRLRRELGHDAKSLSLEPTYLDVHLGRTFSDPDDFEHGVSLHVSIALDGVRQEVATPCYLVVKRLSPRFLGYARAGFPIVLEPDASVGVEAALGSAYFLSANFGIGAELAFSTFYGAATIEQGVTVIPVASLALGVFFDWERLP